MAKRQAAKAKSAPKKHAATKEQHPCVCGGGKTTARTFAQGHDAKTHSLLLKVERRAA